MGLGVYRGAAPAGGTHGPRARPQFMQKRAAEVVCVCAAGHANSDGKRPAAQNLAGGSRMALGHASAGGTGPRLRHFLPSMNPSAKGRVPPVDSRRRPLWEPRRGQKHFPSPRRTSSGVVHAVRPCTGKAFSVRTAEPQNSESLDYYWDIRVKAALSVILSAGVVRRSSILLRSVETARAATRSGLERAGLTRAIRALIAICAGN